MRKIYLILILLLSLNLQAQQGKYYTVTRVSSQNIKCKTCDPQILREGSKIHEKSTILWENNHQWFEAMGSDRKTRYFSRESMASRGKKTILDYLSDLLYRCTHTTSGKDVGQLNVGKNKDFYSEKRLALVIGNANYNNIKSLRTPLNDANLISGDLQELGFDVICVYDCTTSEIKEALEAFSKKVSNEQYDLVLFYYSGHGLKSNDVVNYWIVPVNAHDSKLNSPAEECIDLRYLKEIISISGCSNSIVIWDACRTKKNEGKNDGVLIEAAENMLIAYSTSDDNIAIDADSDTTICGPYATALSEALQTEGLTLTELFSLVDAIVYDNTKKRQRPTESGKTNEKVILHPKNDGKSQEEEKVIEEEKNLVNDCKTFEDYDNNTYVITKGAVNRPEDCFILGSCSYMCYKNSDPIKADTLSFKWVKQAADGGVPEAQERIGDWYLSGGYGISIDSVKASNYYNMASTNDPCIAIKRKQELIDFEDWSIKASKCVDLNTVAEISFHKAQTIKGNYESIFWLKFAYDKAIKAGNMKLAGEIAKQIVDYYSSSIYTSSYDSAKVWYYNAIRNECHAEKELLVAMINYSTACFMSATFIDEIKIPEYDNFFKYFKNISDSALKKDCAEQIGDMYRQMTGYLEGSKMKQAKKEALRWYEIASKVPAHTYDSRYITNKYKEMGGYFSAGEEELYLGRYFDYGVTDKSLVVEYYEKAALKGWSEAQVRLGDIYRTGKDIRGFRIRDFDTNNTIAFKWYEKAKRQDDVSAYVALGRWYYKGKEAEECLLKGYWSKNRKVIGEAAFGLGELYEYGKGVEKNYEKAIYWYKNALLCRYDSALTCFKSGNLYAMGGYGLYKSYDIATDYFMSSINNSGFVSYDVYAALKLLCQNDTAKLSQMEQAFWYNNSNAVECAMFLEIFGNHEDALKYYKKAYYSKGEVLQTRTQRERSQMFAAQRIGNSYNRGELGLKPNHQEAILWYKKAVECGDPSAMIEIAKLYESGGYNLEKNLDEAVRWYRMAVEFDLPEAFEALSRLGYKF